MGTTTPAAAWPPSSTTTTTNPPPTSSKDWTASWQFWFFNLDRPAPIIFIAGLSIVHSLFHFPHLLMYRRLGVLTGFWSIIGVGLILGAIMPNELLYDIWIWYSCVYVPVMLVIMCAVLTMSIWAVELRTVRALLATIAVLFYLFMFYCIVYVMADKRKIWTTTIPTWTCSECEDCAECTTHIWMSGIQKYSTRRRALRQGEDAGEPFVVPGPHAQAHRVAVMAPARAIKTEMLYDWPMSITRTKSSFDRQEGIVRTRGTFNWLADVTTTKKSFYWPAGVTRTKETFYWPQDVTRIKKTFNWPTGVTRTKEILSVGRYREKFSLPKTRDKRSYSYGPFCNSSYKESISQGNTNKI